MKKGIHLGGRTFDRLSGPVSLSYLHPPADHPELPLVLLFGDRHGSDDLCDDCNEEKGCLSILSPTFFHTLDELAREMPVDVFTETNWDHTPKNNESQILFHHFIKSTQSCYDVSKRSVASEPCPTQFVRWHHIDTRLMETTPYVEWHLTKVMYFMKMLYESSLDKKHEFIYPSYQMADAGMKSSTPKWSEIEIKFAVEFIKCIFTPKQTEEQLAEKIVELLFSQIRSQDSLIRKEIERQSTLSLDAFQSQMVPLLFTSPGFTHSIKNFVNYLSLDTPLLLIFRDILMGIFQSKQFFYRVPYDLQTPTLKRDIDIINDVIDFIYHMLIYLTAPLLDMYAIARMIKKPKGNDRGILNIGYYGERHNEGIRHFLSSLFQYDVKVYYPVDKKNGNCLLMKDPMYLEQDMENLAHERYRKFPELANEYKGTLQRESQGRLQHMGHGGRRTVKRKAMSGKKSGKGKAGRAGKTGKKGKKFRR